MSGLPSVDRRRLFLRVDDFSEADVRAIFDRARALSAAGAHRQTSPAGGPPTVGLLFLQPSLRTRVGFAVAAARNGGRHVDVDALRYQENMSAPESFADTIRTISGMVDVVVVRTSFILCRGELERNCVCPCINGGDGDEHPTQALIDLFMIEQRFGTADGLRIGICGDLQSRVVKSLVRLLSRSTLKELRLIGPPSRRLASGLLTSNLEKIATATDEAAFESLDVLYLAGLARQRGPDILSVEARRKFSVSESNIGALSQSSAILCPMPAIDEIDVAVRDDPRICMFQQSDLGVFVRMALLALIAHGR
jgi:aspartate carbamoyltransferase catalytic subunit